MVMQIETNLYSRQGKAVTNFDQKLSPLQSNLASQILKDPYIFDFLSIGEDAHEREIEKSLILHMQKFLLELGEGFSFVGRQFHLEPVLSLFLPHISSYFCLFFNKISPNIFRY